MVRPLLQPGSHHYRLFISVPFGGDTKSRWSLLSGVYARGSKSIPSQIDLIVMDFSKAFDKVRHRRLKYKLDWYSTMGNTRDWILDFLSGRSQRVFLEGTASDSEPIVSPRAPFWDLSCSSYRYINDLTDVAVHSTACLFPDDCITSCHIRNNDDTILQNDLNKIAEWEFMWQMQFEKIILINVSF